MFKNVRLNYTKNIMQHIDIVNKGVMAMAEQKELIVKDDHGVEHNLYNLPKGFVFEGSIRIWDCNLEELPDLSEVTVTGDFCCGDETLTSLKGSPKGVGGDFICSFNQLTSLEGAPEVVGGRFDCEGNKLKTLKGAPKIVGGDFNCSDNQLTSLEGAPIEVGGEFNCEANNLKTFKGGPNVVGGQYYLSYDDDMERSLSQREILILESLQKTRAKIDAKHETDTPSQAQEPKTNSQDAVIAQMIQDKKVQSM